MTNSQKINVFLIVCLGLLLWILFTGRCSRPIENPPQVKSVKEQAEVVRIDSIASANFKDSVNLIIKGLEKSADKWYDNWKTTSMQYNDLEKGMNDLLGEKVPDSCLEIQARLKAQYDKVLKANSIKDISCNQTIASKNNIITQKDKLIAKGKEDWTKLRANLDTCFAQQKKLEDYAKSVKPRNQVYIGITAIGNTNKYYEGVGLNLGLKTKGGMMYEIGALQMGTVTQYTLALKKVISFRKK